MMWQGNGCIVYEIFFVNFWVIILFPVFRTLKPKKVIPKKPRFSIPGNNIIVASSTQT